MELRIKLDKEQENFKNILLILENNDVVNVEPYKYYIFSDKRVCYTLNLSKNIRYFSEFSRIIEFHKENIELCKKLVIIIDNNNLDNFCFEKIIDLLHKYHTKLYKLDITHNNITKNGFRKLFSLIQICPEFDELLCDKNFITSEIFDNLLDLSLIKKSLKDKMKYKQF